MESLTPKAGFADGRDESFTGTVAGAAHWRTPLVRTLQFIEMDPSRMRRSEMRNAIIAAVVVLAMSVAPAFALGKKRNTTTKQMSDREFVTDAARANMTEVELGKLAETRASADQVKTFAKRMVDDHQKALDTLKTVAKNEKITLPAALDSKDQAVKDRLEKLSGSAFDRAYMRAMIKDHRQDVAEFRTESTKAKFADVKQYASGTLPTLEDHLKLAQSTDRSLVGTSGKRSSKKSVG
jgi:putative membrane protein